MKIYDKGIFIFDTLKKIGVDSLAILEAACDENIEYTYKLLMDNPSISKDDFLDLTGFEEYTVNTIPHRYRDYGDGSFNPDRLFNDIKAYANKSKNVNTFIENKPILYLFLDHYYQTIIYSQVKNDDESEYYDFSDELFLPLEERAYDIGSKIKWLVRNGAELNPQGDMQPLIHPVFYLDLHMVELLLSLGASPFFESIYEGDLINGCGNYYIDDIDLTIVNYCYAPVKKDAILTQANKIISLFREYGVTN